MKIAIKWIVTITLLNFTLSSWAASTHIEVDEKVEVITTEEKIEQTQDRIEDVTDRYARGERQFNKWKKAEDIDDYLEVIEDIKIFN